MVAVEMTMGNWAVSVCFGSIVLGSLGKVGWVGTPQIRRGGWWFVGGYEDCQLVL
jgi:hypothetical protein